MMVVHSFFPTLVYRNELPGWANDTNAHTEKYFSAIKKEFNGSNPVVQTRELNGVVELEYIKKYFLDESVHALKKQGYATDNYIFNVSLWGQEYNNLGFNIPHVHSNYQISGLYFFAVHDCDCGSDVLLYDPRYSKLVLDLDIQATEELTPSTPIVKLNKVLTGTFLMFNSWLMHSITENRSGYPIKFLHFNLSCERKK